MTNAYGQYEMVTGPLGPLEAADAIVNTRELIYNVATKHGLKATFAPRIHKLSCEYHCAALLPSSISYVLRVYGKRRKRFAYSRFGAQHQSRLEGRRS